MPSQWQLDVVLPHGFAYPLSVGHLPIGTQVADSTGTSSAAVSICPRAATDPQPGSVYGLGARAPDPSLSIRGERAPALPEALPPRGHRRVAPGGALQLARPRLEAALERVHGGVHQDVP